ncbi:MAG: hypothetical protein AB7T10_02635 [bacterium]
MKKRIILIVMFVISLMLYAKRDYSEEMLNIGSDAFLLAKITAMRGSILVRPTEKDSMLVYCVKSAKEGFSAESVRVNVNKSDSGYIFIDCVFPSGDGEFMGNLEILLPKNISVESIYTEEGDINLEANYFASDTVRVKTIKGSIMFTAGEDINAEIIMTSEPQTVLADSADSCSSCSDCPSKQKEKRILLNEGKSKVILTVVEGTITTK